ncbi:MAG: hypothetical protein NC310_00250 [Roseburia sp.]|nr:hypothetical protein [Anaeroplasma bactoclasticum]MCM1195483.1 hypothetical protein [Roseburia sp.]
MKRKVDASSLLKNLLAYVIVFLVLMIEGCFNFVELRFHIEYFVNLEFWISIVFRVFLLVAIRTAAMLIFLDIARAKNMDLKNAKDLNDKYMKLKGDDFSEYIDTVKNPKIKIKAWKEQIHRKLAKLEKRAKPEDRALYFKNGDEYSIQKEENDYCRQRKLLEEQISDNFIEDNLETLIIKKKFPQIDSAVFNLPVGNENWNKRYQITAKTKNAVASSIALAAVVSLVTQTIRQAIEASPTDVYMLNVLIGIIMDLIFIVVQFWSGIFSAFSKIRTEEVAPYVNRNAILKEYLFWKNPKDHDTFAKWVAQLEEATKSESKIKPEA